MADETVEFSVAQRDAADGAPGATAAFPYDRMTVERFREAFPRARWRDDLGAWFVPGTRAERRLKAWMSREWSGVLAYADQRGRDAFAFEPITSRYLEVADGFVIQTPYSRAVIAELRAVPWARWDPALKAWRVPFRSFEDLRKRWPAIEGATRLAEPKERRKRAEGRKASPEHEERRAEAAERRRRRYPVPEDAPPPLDRVLMTHAGCVMFETITGELAEPMIAARFYPGVTAGPAALIWAAWRMPSHAELVWACPACEDTSDRLKGLEVTMPEGVKRRRSFPEAFKREAVAAIHGGRSVSQVAAELGLPDRLVRSWLRWAEGRTPAASGAPVPTPPRAPAAPARRVGPSPADQAAEIARLRRENERLRMERDILQRAALIFGQATGRR